MAGETLALDLRARAAKLIEMGQEMLLQADAMADTPPDGVALLDSDREILVRAKWTLEDRKRRSRFFRSDLFGEPGWHILLDLFIQQKVGKRTSVMAARIGSGAATTTALRYLALLIEDGLVEREGDPSDGRRSWLSLTPQAMETMTEYLDAGTMPQRSVPGRAIGTDWAQRLT